MVSNSKQKKGEITRMFRCGVNRTFFVSKMRFAEVPNKLKHYIVISRLSVNSLRQNESINVCIIARTVVAIALLPRNPLPYFLPSFL